MSLCRGNTGDIQEFKDILSELPRVDPNIYNQVLCRLYADCGINEKLSATTWMVYAVCANCCLNSISFICRMDGPHFVMLVMMVVQNSLTSFSTMMLKLTYQRM